MKQKEILCPSCNSNMEQCSMNYTCPKCNTMLNNCDIPDLDVPGNGSIKDKAIEIIESLLETIGWLGGDSYEMECVENMTKEAHEFLREHKPEPIIIEKDRTDSMNGLYCLHGDETKKVEASNKKEAANKFNVGKGQIQCLVIPGTKLKIKS